MPVRVSASAPAFALAPYDYGDVRALMDALELAEPVAVTLVRRGHRTVEDARRFLAADDSHDPFELGGMSAAVAAISTALEAGRRITVFGDYDVDGVTSTAIMVSALRDLGGDCDWYIPDRLGDGYGLSEPALRGLAARGTRLLVTVDCGITSVTEVALAHELGMDVVVTDHHQPADELPDCPIVHPLLGDYPCPDLCAAGVAHKVACALLGHERAERDLDLVALATVADMVPLHGENRSLVRRGLAEARRGRRPGLRALMAAASVVPERLDEGDVAFRLAPRINAAGRLYRADAGVELMLTADEARAEAIAGELNRANGERRETEAAVVEDAERQISALPDELSQAPALVLWGEGWHPGVVGICASRLVERHGKPTVLIALGEDGGGRGSGRSVAGFDLLGGLRACESHLRRYGGHVAAAGLELDRAALEPFRDAFVAHAATEIDLASLAPAETVDAVVGGESLGHAVAEQIARLGPFGKGNPGVRLLVPAARIADVRPMGEGERHARFSIAGTAGRAAGVAFGVNGSLRAAALAGPLDVSVKLELNHWNGAVEPRVVLGELHACEEDDAVVTPPPADPAEFWERFERELARALDGTASSVGDVEAPQRQVMDRRGSSGLATIAALVSGGSPVLVLVADAARRRELLVRAASPARYGCEAAVLAGRLSRRRDEEAVACVFDHGAGTVLADWVALEARPELAARFEHVVIVDPAPGTAVESLAMRATERGGYAHLLWGEPELEFAERVLEADHAGRATLAALYRDLRACGPDLAGESLLRALCGEGPRPRSPELAARCVRVLAALGAASVHGFGPDRALRVVSSGVAELSGSAEFAAYGAAYEENRRFLSELRQRS